MTWSLSMYERLLRLDGQLLVDVAHLDPAAACAALTALFPDVARATATLAELERQRRHWTASEDRRLRELYPSTSTKDLARMFGRPLTSVYQRALGLGLRKSAEYLAGPQACRLRRGDNIGAAHRFPKGHQPFNKGRKGWDSGGRSSLTRFKKGNRPHTWEPIGSERLSKDGYLQRKVTDTGYPPRDWKGVHTLLWEEKHGPVPPGHCLAFKDGNKTRIELDNLELITRAERMRRNTIHRYPPELKDAIRLAAKLRRTLEERTGT